MHPVRQSAADKQRSQAVAGLGGAGVGRSRERASAGGEGPQHQSCPGLGGERGGLAGQPFPAGRDRVHVRGAQRVADDRRAARGRASACATARSASWCTTRTPCSSSGMPHNAASRNSCSTAVDSRRQAADRPAGMAASSCTGSGSVSRWTWPCPATRNAGPSWPAAASASSAAGSSAVPPGMARTENPALARSTASPGEPGQHPVDGPDLRRERVAVHQQREPVVPGTRPVARGPPVGLHLQVRGVAVVPVGDQRLPRGEVGGDRRDARPGR